MNAVNLSGTWRGRLRSARIVRQRRFHYALAGAMLLLCGASNLAQALRDAASDGYRLRDGLDAAAFIAIGGLFVIQSRGRSRSLLTAAVAVAYLVTSILLLSS